MTFVFTVIYPSVTIKNVCILRRDCSSLLFLRWGFVRLGLTEGQNGNSWQLQFPLSCTDVGVYAHWLKEEVTQCPGRKEEEEKKSLNPNGKGTPKVRSGRTEGSGCFGSDAKRFLQHNQSPFFFICIYMESPCVFFFSYQLVIFSQIHQKPSAREEKTRAKQRQYHLWK